MRYADLTRKLVRCGCEFDRQARGSHEIWRSRIVASMVSEQLPQIPNYGSKDLQTGIVRSIIHDLGIDKEEFDRA